MIENPTFHSILQHVLFKWSVTFIRMC